MKGIISPELRAIMANRDKWKKFVECWDNLRYSPEGAATIDLGDGDVVTIRKFGSNHKPKKTKPKRNLWELLFPL